MGLRFKVETRDVSLFHSVHTHASDLSQGHSPGVKRPELGNDNSLDLLSMLLFFVTVLKLNCGLHNVILTDLSAQRRHRLEQCFSTAGPRPGTGPWHQLYRAARGSPGICHFNVLRIFMNKYFIVEIL